MDQGTVREIIDRYEGDEGMLVPIMQDLQRRHGYLPAAELRTLAAELKVPLTRVYGIARFYTTFRMEPRGEHDVTFCLGTVCHLKGAARISEEVCREFGIEAGGTTADGLFTHQTVNCVGACALAPVAILDGKYHDKISVDSALKLLRRLSRREARGGAAASVAAEGQES